MSFIEVTSYVEKTRGLVNTDRILQVSPIRTRAVIFMDWGQPGFETVETYEEVKQLLTKGESK